MRAYVLQDSVLVGERFRLAVAATHPPGVVPVFPDEGVADSVRLAGGLMLGEVEVLRRMERAVQDTPGGQVDSVVYEAATFALDSAAVGPIRVQVGTAEVRTTPFWLPVKTTLPPEAQGIRDLAPLAEFPIPFWRWLLVGLAFAAVVGTLAYLLVRYRLRRDQHVPEVLLPPLSPFEAALQRLALLERTDLSREGTLKPFYVEMSDVLRRYLTERLGVQAMEETTHELVRELQTVVQRQPLPAALPQAVQHLLAQADLVKFADARPSAEQSQTVLTQTRATLEAIETALRPAVPQDTPVPEAIPA